jgi:hypothetical protein
MIQTSINLYPQKEHLMSNATGVIKSFDPSTGRGVISLAPDSIAIANGTMNGMVKFDIKDGHWRGGSNPKEKMNVSLVVENGRVTAISPL